MVSPTVGFRVLGEILWTVWRSWKQDRGLRQNAWSRAGSFGDKCYSGCQGSWLGCSDLWAVLKAGQLKSPKKCESGGQRAEGTVWGSRFGCAALWAPSVCFCLDTWRSGARSGAVGFGLDTRFCGHRRLGSVFLRKNKAPSRVFNSLPGGLTPSPSWGFNPRPREDPLPSAAPCVGERVGD